MKITNAMRQEWLMRKDTVVASDTILNKSGDDFLNIYYAASIHIKSYEMISRTKFGAINKAIRAEQSKAPIKKGTK